jgi:hypothetical protein
VGPSHHPESCYGPHTIFLGLWIWGNATYRGGAQILLRIRFQWRAVRRLQSRWFNQVGGGHGHLGGKTPTCHKTISPVKCLFTQFPDRRFCTTKDLDTKDQRKLCPAWEGPYEVVEMTRPGSYRLQWEDSYRVPNSWNDDQLRPFYM